MESQRQLTEEVSQDYIEEIKARLNKISEYTNSQLNQ